ncbi:unnamed protein product [Auanema sp. JU1783]|nr:unnamed protein product [Auanema sp. JU1783]
MNTEEAEKPKYFGNVDFEKTVNDIISSPRRCKSYMYDYEIKLFEISEKQREYYLKCFRHLLKSTQGVITDIHNAALNGADRQVVDFFRKSGLDTESLSRIWTLSDVNEDGWLDLNEFSMAMHLIVLNVKGEVPIPNVLPAHVKPPFTPSRSNSQMQGQISPASYNLQNQNSLPAPSSSQEKKNSLGNSWDQFEMPDCKNNIEKEEVALKEFSDVPPLLVDIRPTAVKPSVVPLLSLKSPSGPPPQPPPRPVQKGHGRSASLDLKSVNLNSQSSFPLFPAGERRDSDTTIMNTVAPPLSARPTLSGPIPVLPPPVPQRTSPGTSSKNAETQTEKEMVDKDLLERFIKDMGSDLDDLLRLESEPSEGVGVERWELRCRALKLQNAELEQERARLAQVRIQLELRLQEVEDTYNTKGKTSRPTAL